jgi:hypothetical protein
MEYMPIGFKVITINKKQLTNKLFFIYICYYKFIKPSYHVEHCSYSLQHQPKL